METIPLKFMAHSDPDFLAGVPVFVGTQVTVATLFKHLEASDGLEAFLGDQTTVSREQAVAAIRRSATLLDTEVRRSDPVVFEVVLSPEAKSLTSRAWAGAPSNSARSTEVPRA